MLGLLRRFDEPPMEAGLRSTWGRAHRPGLGYRPSWRRRGSQATVAEAQAKRERKAAKRRRDAELTRLGQEASRRLAALVTGSTAVWRLPPSWGWRTWVTALHATRTNNRAYRADFMARLRRRGEVTS